jgi:hypothetical protein
MTLGYDPQASRRGAEPPVIAARLPSARPKMRADLGDNGHSPPRSGRVDTDQLLDSNLDTLGGVHRRERCAKTASRQLSVAVEGMMRAMKAHMACGSRMAAACEGMCTVAHPLARPRSAPYPPDRPP